MISVDKISCFNIECALRGMRNPMNSWSKSDSKFDTDTGEFIIGDKDLTLAHKLIKAGTDHRKFLRQIFVSMDITAPMYWWKEFDTYKVGTVRNSCSTMHKIHAEEFTFDDFSHDKLDELGLNILGSIIDHLNNERNKYIITKDKCYWYHMIQLLPSSYNQKATVTLNYESLLNIYNSRKDHKLEEWRKFCSIMESIPFFKEICLED